jgi:hypothetical protein
MNGMVNSLESNANAVTRPLHGCPRNYASMDLIACMGALNQSLVRHAISRIMSRIPALNATTTTLRLYVINIPTLKTTQRYGLARNAIRPATHQT